MEGTPQACAEPHSNIHQGNLCQGQTFWNDPPCFGDIIPAPHVECNWFRVLINLASKLIAVIWFILLISYCQLLQFFLFHGNVCICNSQLDCRLCCPSFWEILWLLSATFTSVQFRYFNKYYLSLLLLHIFFSVFFPLFWSCKSLKHYL